MCQGGHRSRPYRWPGVFCDYWSPSNKFEAIALMESQSAPRPCRGATCGRPSSLTVHLVTSDRSEGKRNSRRRHKAQRCLQKMQGLTKELSRVKDFVVALAFAAACAGITHAQQGAEEVSAALVRARSLIDAGKSDEAIEKLQAMKSTADPRIE